MALDSVSCLFSQPQQISYEVDGEIVRAVMTFLDYELEVRKALQPIDADNAIAKMEQKIVRQVDVLTPTKRELARSVHADRAGRWIFQTALENVEKDRKIHFDEVRGRYVLADQAFMDAPVSVTKPN